MLKDHNFTVEVEPDLLRAGILDGRFSRSAGFAIGRNYPLRQNAKLRLAQQRPWAIALRVGQILADQIVKRNPPFGARLITIKQSGQEPMRMFSFETPLLTQIVVYGFLFAFAFGAAIPLFELVERAIGTRPAGAPARR